MATKKKPNPQIGRSGFSSLGVNRNPQAGRSGFSGIPGIVNAPPQKGLPNTAGNPGPSAPPPDPTYEAYRASAGRNISLGDAEATYQHANISNEYGIGDSSNPYSKAAMLQESYNRAKLGTTNGLAAQGQLYSGAMTNAQNENDHQYSIQNDALQRAYAAAQHSVNYGQAQNYANNAIGVSDQGFAALLRSLGMG